MSDLSVQIIGAGLIGGSLSLALARAGIIHQISDIDSNAGKVLEAKGDSFSNIAPGDIDLVVIAVPPDQVTFEILRAFDDYPNSIITDLSSIKAPYQAMVNQTEHMNRYVGSHPMAGKELNGPDAADSNLFADRVWIVCETETNADAVNTVIDLIERVHAIPVRIPAAEHDVIVSYLSHLPQIIASSLAELAVSSKINLEVAGPAFRDMTRISRSNPELWTQITSANRDNIADAISGLEQRLSTLKRSLYENDVESIRLFFENSSSKSRQLPGKHGGMAKDFGTFSLRVVDEPGSLAKVFNLAAQIELNIEDIAIEHVLNRPLAVITLQVNKTEIDRAKREYHSRGWEIRE